MSSCKPVMKTALLMTMITYIYPNGEGVSDPPKVKTAFLTLCLAVAICSNTLA